MLSDEGDGCALAARDDETIASGQFLDRSNLNSGYAEVKRFGGLADQVNMFDKPAL